MTPADQARPAYCVIRRHHTREQHQLTCRPVIAARAPREDYVPYNPDWYAQLAQRIRALAASAR